MINPARKIILLYLCVGGLWVLFSDGLLSRVHNPQVLTTLSIIKGWFFIAITATLLYVLLNRHFIRLQESRHAQTIREERLSLALASTRMGVWEWDLINDTVFWSSECHGIVGLADFDGTFQAFARLLHPDDAERVMAEVQRCLQSQTHYFDEFRIIRPDGQMCWLCNHGNARYAQDGTPVVLLGTVQDISERKRIEAELQASEARYRAVVEDQTEVICRFLPDGTITFVNEVYCRLFGKTATELLGNKWQPIAHIDDLPQITEKLAGMTPDQPVVAIENRVIVASGELRWMQFVNRGFYDTRGVLFETQAVGRDISDRKRTEETLRHYAQQLIDQDEHLRKTLAAELHDDICQDLAALGLNLTLLKSQVPEQHVTLEQSQKLQLKITRTVRELMSGLRPPDLDDFGLVAALRWFIAVFTTKTGLPVDLDVCDGFPHLPPDRELALYRIVQEALNNASRHSKATTVRISLIKQENGQTRITISDDGAGFDLGRVQRRSVDSGWGLISMKERAESVNGHFTIDSAPGNGTTISITLQEEV